MVRLCPTLGPRPGPTIGPGDTFNIAITAHGLSAGDGPFTATTTGTLPAGMALLTNYYAIVDDANHIRIATSYANAVAGTATDITGAGSGVHTLVTGAATTTIAPAVSTTFTAAAAFDTLTLAADPGISTRMGPFRVSTTSADLPALE
mgnify:FL=1